MFAARSTRHDCPKMSAMRLNATAYMRRQGFVEHEGFFLESTMEKGRPCVIVWNDLNVYCTTVADAKEAREWISLKGETRH